MGSLYCSDLLEYYLTRMDHPWHAGMHSGTSFSTRQTLVWMRAASLTIFIICHFSPDPKVVFNIKGNKYWLVAAIQYAFGIMFIRFVGTHKDYDEIDAVSI